MLIEIRCKNCKELLATRRNKSLWISGRTDLRVTGSILRFKCVNCGKIKRMLPKDSRSPGQ